MNDAPGWYRTQLASVAMIDPETVGGSGDELIDYISLEDVTRGLITARTQVRLVDAPSRARRRLCAGDVLFGTVRPNLQSHAHYKGGFRNPVASTGFAVLRARPGVAIPGFLGQWVLGADVSHQVDQLIAGSNYPAISNSDVRQFQICLPDIHTQAEIASVLEDGDDLIATLERLVAKKQDIRQGIMQRLLLTDQSRLPGFTDPWEWRKFDDVMQRVNAKKYQVPASSYKAIGRLPVVDQGQQPIIGYTDETRAGFGPGIDGTIVFGDHTCITKFVDFPFAVGADGTQVLRALPGNSARFFAYVLEINPVASRGYNRHFKDLREKVFPTPTLTEQTAISDVLGECDREIGVLRRRLVKARAVKQGMMQELLSGRTRLPVNEIAA